MNKYADLAPSRSSKKHALFLRVRGSASMCLRKTSYTTEEGALKRAAMITATANGTTMRAYKCPHCYNYHLTSKPLHRDMRKDPNHG